MPDGRFDGRRRRRVVENEIDGSSRDSDTAQVSDSVEDMLAPEALARVLGRPRSRPYRLQPRHRWQVKVAGDGRSALIASDSQQGA